MGIRISTGLKGEAQQDAASVLTSGYQPLLGEQEEVAVNSKSR